MKPQIIPVGSRSRKKRVALISTLVAGLMASTVAIGAYQHAHPSHKETGTISSIQVTKNFRHFSRSDLDNLAEEVRYQLGHDSCWINLNVNNGIQANKKVEIQVPNCEKYENLLKGDQLQFTQASNGNISVNKIIEKVKNRRQEKVREELGATVTNAPAPFGHR